MASVELHDLLYRMVPWFSMNVNNSSTVDEFRKEARSSLDNLVEIDCDEVGIDVAAVNSG